MAPKIRPSLTDSELLSQRLTAKTFVVHQQNRKRPVNSISSPGSKPLSQNSTVIMSSQHQGNDEDIEETKDGNENASSAARRSTTTTRCQHPGSISMAEDRSEYELNDDL